MDRIVRDEAVGKRAQDKRARGRVRALRVCGLLALLLLGCTVDERGQLPAEAQSLIDQVTEEIAAGQSERIYQHAAEEWRTSATEGESRANLEMVRDRLGRVQSRRMHSGRETPAATGAQPAPRRLVIIYETKFERGTGMETFTLLEREGRWLLAGYKVTSDVLRQ